MSAGEWGGVPVANWHVHECGLPRWPTPPCQATARAYTISTTAQPFASSSCCSASCCPPLQVAELLLQALQPAAGHHTGQVQHRRVVADGHWLCPRLQGCGGDGGQGQRGGQGTREGRGAQALQQRRLLGGGRRQRLPLLRLPERLHRCTSAPGRHQGRAGGVGAAAAACPG